MAISALSNSLLPQFTSLPNLVTPLQTAQQSVVSGNTSSAQLASDTYTQSGQGAQASSNNSSSGTLSSVQPNSVSDVPQSVLAAMAKYGDPVQKAWSTLQDDVVSGDISSAQTDLNNYTQALSSSNYGMSSLTTPSAQFLGDLTSLGSALQAGNLTDVQSDFATAKANLPLDVSSAVALATAQAEADGGKTVQGIEATSSLSGVNYGQLSSDITNLDGVKREAETNISDFLVTQGFSASDASTYASAMTDISNGSAANNDHVDATLTTQWVDALSRYAQEGTAPTWFDGAATPSNSMFTVLNGVVDATSITAWNQTQALLKIL